MYEMQHHMVVDAEKRRKHGETMTHDEYMALDPRTIYQIEKERRQDRVNNMTARQLKEAKTLMDEGKEQRSAQRRGGRKK